MATYTYGAREGGGKPLDPDFLGRFEHPHPLVIDGKEIDDGLVVVVENDRIIIESNMSDKQLVYKLLTDKEDILYEVADDKTQAQAVVVTGSYEGRVDVDGIPFTPMHHQMSRSTHIISVYYNDRHPNKQPYAQLNSNTVRRILQDIFEKHWRKPEKDTMTTAEDFMDMVDHYYKEMSKFVETTTFNRVVTGSSEVPPIDDDHPIIDHPIIDHPIIPDIPVDNTKDETDGPLIGKWDLVPKDGDGGGVLPLAVGGGAALILLLMVK